ncbi:hypothetical protein FOZ62_018292 [Perkinsus olseni]|uniref:Uncharacterized protein n=1 Tax=Perkinsus olseni TaxID=32597 RepID=A0A7J6THD5_PEROL|nr:hypothetical protein FOZ62_018292 [Perkinsus olseni]
MSAKHSVMVSPSGVERLVERLAIIVQSNGVEGVLHKVLKTGCSVLLACYPSEASPAVSTEEYVCTVLRTVDENVLVAAVTAFNPDLILVLPSLFAYPKGSLSAYRIWEMRYSGVEMGSKPWPEYDLITAGRERVGVELVDDDTRLATEEVAVIASSDTALTLRFKMLEACRKFATSWIVPVLKTLVENREQAAPVASVDPLEVSVESDRAKASAHFRGMSFAPRCEAIAVRTVGSEGCDFLVDEIGQLDRITEAVQEGKGFYQSSPSKKADVSRGFAADTHFYSNVGGSIVKMDGSSEGGCLDDIPRVEVASDAIPGSAVSGSMPKKLRMNEPFIGPNAGLYLARALKSGWIGVEGPWVKKFERRIASICGGRAACAVQSGTAALYGAMKALGVSKPSHFVICPAYTCAACADAVVHAGGTPLICDVERDSYALSYDAAVEALDHPVHGLRILGMIVAPCYGVPARDYLKLVKLCKERSIWLCEDNCESYGATVVDESGSRVRLGALGTVSVISTRSEKMVGVGEGGAIVSDNVDLVAAARWWCSRAPCVGQGLWHVYDHESVGQNFRMPELLGAVGVAAAEMLPVMISRKRAIHAWYEENLADLVKSGMIQLQNFEPTDEPVWWLNAVFLRVDGLRGETVGMELMRMAPEIEIRPGFFPLGMMKPFQGGTSLPCPVAELLYEKILCLPSSHNLTERDVNHVCATLKKALCSTATSVDNEIEDGLKAIAA